MRVLVETPRLILRELDSDDIEFVAAMLADPDVMAYWPQPLTREQAGAWLRKQQERYETHGHGYWLAVEKATGEAVGQIGLLPTKIDGEEQAALGYMLHRPYWGRGLATEGAGGVLLYARDVLGKPRVVAPIRPSNIPSLRVAWRLRMIPTHMTTLADFEHLVLVTTPETWRVAHGG
jgi:RimJ/RimL family protein N-acetyltransferase